MQLVLDYLAAIEREAEPIELAAFFSPDVKQHEFPNRLVARGAARGLEEILAGSRKGRLVVQDQRYLVKNAVVDGDRIALELTWTGKLKVPFGSLAVGATMTADCGVFFRIEAGRIAEQHNYDCFEPF